MKIILIAFIICLSGSNCFAKVRFGTEESFEEVDHTNDKYLRYARHMTVPFLKQYGPAWEAGNDVTGKTPDEIKLIVKQIKLLETDRLQTDILAQMLIPPSEWFTFRDLSHAQNVVQQRLATVTKMSEFNAYHQYQYTSPQPGQHPHTTASFWRPRNAPEFFFRQIGGTASTAIAQLCSRSSTTWGECYGACVACIWWGASQGMGTIDFDSLYPGTGALLMTNKKRVHQSPFRNTYLPVESDKNVHVPGDWVYFKNHNYKEVIAFESEFQTRGWLRTDRAYQMSGENAFYSGLGFYEGLGERQRKSKMIDDLRGAYNRDFEQVIDEVSKDGGLYKGVEIERIELSQAEALIQIIEVRRIGH